MFITLGFDGLVFVLTVMKTYQTAKEARQLTKNISLSQLLLRDGMHFLLQYVFIAKFL